MSKEFIFKDVDQEGLETLKVISEAVNFNSWMYQTILPYCSGNILEIGSGIGNISEYFLKREANITLSDIRDNYCAMLHHNLSHYPNLMGVEKINIIDPEFDLKHKALMGKFDSIYALNIVEHVKDDEQAIANCKKLLKVGGKLVILVPAYQALYNTFDKELEHYLRYNQGSLDQLFRKNNLQIIHRQYFNFVGIFGWILSGTILKKKTIPEGQMKLYDRLVPIIRFFDRLVNYKMGLSVITVGIKQK